MRKTLCAMWISGKYNKMLILSNFLSFKYVNKSVDKKKISTLVHIFSLLINLSTFYPHSISSTFLPNSQPHPLIIHITQFSTHLTLFLPIYISFYISSKPSQNKIKIFPIIPWHFPNFCYTILNSTKLIFHLTRKESHENI